MSLNPLYIIASDLQSTFLDKDTGQPMVGGTINFYQDAARTTPMPVFILSGTYGSYSYTNIGSTVTLGSAGNVQYQGNDVILYYYPYLGSSTSPGALTLYYVTCYNSNSVLQFTREAWPNLDTASSTNTNNIFNYIPNGQFSLVNANQANGSSSTGTISQGTTVIAQGGWTFERPSNSTATDIVTFTQGQYSQNPSESPRNILNVQTTVVGTNNSYKDVRIKFLGVNTFSDPNLTYTFSFAGQSVVGNATINLSLIRYFGSNGSASPSATQIAQFVLTNTMQNFTYNALVFPANSTYSVGTNQDDYIQLVLTLPTNVQNNINLTDFILTPGQVSINQYPIQSIGDTISRCATPSTIPAQDGSTLFLRAIYSQSGLTYDSSDIGDIVLESCYNNYSGNSSTVTNRLLCNGAQYQVNGYSSLGIPYKRLFNCLFNSTVGVPVYGTGLNFLTASYNSSATEIRITNNSGGPVTNASDGTAATGFTFTTIAKAPSSTYTYAVKAYLTATATFWSQGSNLGAVHANASLTGLASFSVSNIQVGSSVLSQIDAIVCPAAGSVNVGASNNNYITIWAFASGVGTNALYIWYKVAGSGTNPSPTISGATTTTGIEVDLESGDTAAIVAAKTREALNAWQITMITSIAAGSAITNSSYFNINSINTSNVSVPYYVWFNKNNTGTDPAVASSTGIVVAYTGSETATQMAQKIQVAINSTSYAVPDARGQFFRAFDNGAGVDPDASTRFSMVPGVQGNTMGTFQLSAVISHNHPPASGTTSFITQTGGSTSSGTVANSFGLTTSTGFGGGTESRPIDMYVNVAIKY